MDLVIESNCLMMHLTGTGRTPSTTAYQHTCQGAGSVISIFPSHRERSSDRSRTCGHPRRDAPRISAAECGCPRADPRLPRSQETIVLDRATTSVHIAHRRACQRSSACRRSDSSLHSPSAHRIMFIWFLIIPPYFYSCHIRHLQNKSRIEQNLFLSGTCL